MDEWEALNTFWNSFGLDAYDENTVPDDVQMPYITYEAVVAGFDDKVMLSGALWYKSQSWVEISQKEKQIRQEIGSGYGVKYQGGRLWITMQSPFATRLSDPNDEKIRRINLAVEAEFQTAF